MSDSSHDRHWPRDAPVRWDRLVGRLGYQLVAVVSLAAHLVIGFLLLFRLGSDVLDWVIALAWGGLALVAVWSWWFHRWRVAAAPIVIAALAVVSGRGLI
jgi:hypothetical protein